MLYRWFYLFFFFKQKTAYEMRISDWSSDVCSSDLRSAGDCRRQGPAFRIDVEEPGLQTRGYRRRCRRDEGEGRHQAVARRHGPGPRAGAHPGRETGRLPERQNQAERTVGDAGEFVGVQPYGVRQTPFEPLQQRAGIGIPACRVDLVEVRTQDLRA